MNAARPDPAGIWLLFLCCAGCPAREDLYAAEGDAGGGTNAATDDLARLSSALCAREVACGCGSTMEEGGGSVTCEEWHSEGLRRLAETAAEAEGYVFDEVCLHELADCWEQLDCEQSRDDALLCAPSCAVHASNAGRGEACENEEYVLGPPGFVTPCEPGLTCLGGHGYAVCDTDAPLQVGERCSPGGHRSCASDSFCSPMSRCEPRRVQGSACEQSTMCATGLRCDEGFCRPVGEPGEDCASDPDCGTDLECHPTEGVCVALPAIGEVCRFPTEFGVEFLPCVEGAWCGDPYCEPPPDPNAPLPQPALCEAIPSYYPY